ncbi:hypothetical protein [Oceanobacter mangrovi]|uniref:hypothetical protein n=1 Tax=Oceanobacter mangrovi TaxID=2862510 RepID=UPI001C8F163B|nr:hypothetical protein [Oceanobacter mangrovi]
MDVFMAPTATLAVDPVVMVELQHNLDLSGDATAWVVQFISAIQPDLILYVDSDVIRFSLADIVQGEVYRLVAFGTTNSALLNGLLWVDGYVYDAGQASIEFTSGDSQGGDGEAKTFSGSVLIEGQGVSRAVYAIALDAVPPYLLPPTQSSTDGSYTLEWNGYSGQLLVTALDDYGVDFETGLTLGEGDRVHPTAPNGYVYEAANLGTLGAEPTWPAAEAGTVVSGSVTLVAVPFWRPKSSGPFSV